ncbi:MAG: META domain-containing protein, partial [Chitinophagaceae bacterium]|nr:META domain-containing protein [Chitinophagaceae bacterium]
LKISFSEDMALTKKYCPGDGETVFLNILHRVNSYSVKDNILTLLMDDVEMMRFEKK